MSQNYPEGLTSQASYWTARSQELDALDRAAKASAENKHDRLIALRAERAGVSWADPRDEELSREIKALEAGIRADDLREMVAAGWTVEETNRRRAEWNARVQAGEFGKLGSGKIDAAAVARAQERQGWTLADLKKARELHEIQ